MKILQVIDTLNIGGAERMCVNISNLLTSNRIDNSIIVTRKFGAMASQVSNNKVNLISKNWGFDLFALFRFIRVVNSLKPSVLHAHSTSIFWSVLIKMIFPKMKLIYHDHSGSTYKQTNRLVKFINNYIDVIIAINELNYNWYLSNMSRNNVNLFFIANFPVLSHENDIHKVRNKESLVIVHTANLRDPKDHFTHIKAIAKIKENKNRRHDFQVRFVGGWDDDVYLNNVKKMIIYFGLDNNITLVGATDNIAGELFEADIGILTSSSEGLPVSLLEYGLAGLPVISTNVGECGKVLKNGEFGRLIEVGDFEKLAMDIIYFMDNTYERHSLGYKFKEHVELNYGSGRFYNDYLKIID
jgi:glycosyltransferase involved in cell wall biosynthesis